MPSKLRRAIGAVKDQTSIGLAKVSTTASSALEVAVLKATTHDDVPIDEKYVYEVLQLVSSTKFHAASGARAIGKRIGRTRNWIVALKSLVLVLRIFQDGDPYFPREVLHAMKRGAKILNLSTFRDDSSSSSPWDFTSFVRTFALYLDERLECFLTGKLQRRIYSHEPKAGQRCLTMGRRRPDEPVLDMKPAMLLDRITFWQRLLDRAIATRPTGAARTNLLVQRSLYAIVQESFELYKDVSEGLRLVLDNFFHLQFQNCMNAFQACAKAARQFKELNNFYALCKTIGVGRISEYPAVEMISEELIETLQEFLKDQSSFSSNPKTINRITLPAKSEKSKKSIERSPSEVERQCTSLEDLIKATEETATCPAISIDLEAYPVPQRYETLAVSETASNISLPVTNSMVDLMSIWDGSDQDEKEQQKRLQGSWTLDNWELALAETMPSLSPPQQPFSDSRTASFVEENHATTNSGNSPNNWEVVLFEASPEPSPRDSQQTFSGSTTTSFVEQNHATTNSGNSSNSWEVGLFEPSPAPPPPYFAIPPSNYYNPFLQDAIDVSNVQPAMPLPTFQAIPSFPVQFPNSFTMQNEKDDPFAVTSFSDESMFSSSLDQQNLLHEQQSWLRNQNNIIAKHI